MRNSIKTLSVTTVSGLLLSISLSLSAAPWDKEGYTLVMHDEFDTPVLNEGLWFKWYLPHWSTREKTLARYELKDGKLILKIEPDQVPWDPEHDGKTVISGVQTANKNWLHKWSKDYQDIKTSEPLVENYMQKYGYFEIRAKTQKGSGIHSAWWMIGLQDDAKNWDYSKKTTEVDIFEILGKRTDQALFNNHVWNDPDTKERSNYVDLGFDSSEDFHVYGFEWNENNMSFYVDGVLKRTMDTSVPYAMLTMMSLYEKRHGGWTGPFDETVPYPKKFEIDYFRAYQRNDMIHRNNEGEHATLHGETHTDVKYLVASNNRYARFLGNGAENYMEFKHLYVNETRDYQVSIDYISGDDRDLFVSVNGATPVKLADLNSGGWWTVGTRTFTTKLLKGNNTIKLFNNDAYAPDIDRLRVE